MPDWCALKVRGKDTQADTQIAETTRNRQQADAQKLLQREVLEMVGAIGLEPMTSCV